MNLDCIGLFFDSIPTFENLAEVYFLDDNIVFSKSELNLTGLHKGQ